MPLTFYKKALLSDNTANTVITTKLIPNSKDVYYAIALLYDMPI